MKRFYIILLLLSCSFVMFFICGCSKADETYKLTTDEQVVIYGEQTSLPTIKLNNKIINWDEFYYENEDGYIYVYDGKIFLTETTPDEFETELKIIYKNDNDINTTILINKPYIQLTSVNVEITNQRIYPGEYVYYNVNYQPQNAILKNYTVEFDKPEYIESLENGKFKLKYTTPLNEKIKIVIMTDNNISNEQEITIANTVYEVYNVAQLRRMANDPYGYFKLMKDIDLRNTQWLPIQNFYGVLNGNSHTISGLEYKLESKSKNTDNNFGFIKKLYGVVRDINFCDININIHKQHDNIEIMTLGGVCGYMQNGQIYNIKITNSAIYGYHDNDDKKVKTWLHIGGICGKSEASIIQNCIIENSKIYGGTSINTNEDSIADCWTHAGGIVGTLIKSNLNMCQRKDTVDVTAYVHSGSNTSAYHCSCGGISGCSYESKIIECVSSEIGLDLITNIENDRHANTSTENINAICAGIIS